MFLNPGSIENAQAFQRGEERGFTFFFNDLYPGLCYYAFRMIDDERIAKEIVADSFIKIWEQHAGFDHPRTIQSWLYTAVRNACLNLLQKEKRDREKHKKWVDTQETSERTVYGPPLEVQVTQKVHDMIRTLPPECQRVFILLFIAGKSIQEVSKELTIAVSTVKSHRQYGLKLLKKRFPDLKLLYQSDE